MLKHHRHVNVGHKGHILVGIPATENVLVACWECQDKTERMKNLHDDIQKNLPYVLPMAVDHYGHAVNRIRMLHHFDDQEDERVRFLMEPFERLYDLRRFFNQRIIEMSPWRGISTIIAQNGKLTIKEVKRKPQPSYTGFF